MDGLFKNEKVKLILKILLMALGIFVAVKYVLPLIWPVVVGYIMAKLITPCVEFLHKKIQFNRNLAIVIVLTIFVVIVSVAGFYIGKVLISQIKSLAQNWNIIMTEVDGKVRNVCDGVERGLCLTENEIYNMVSDGFYSCLESGRKKVVSILMNNSVSAFIKMLEGVVAVLLAIMSAFFFVRDEENIKKWLATYPFAAETKFASEKISFVFKAFLKAQLIIMIGNSIICFIGLVIIHNPYSLLLAIGIGLMDALPLLGMGLVLIPWAIVCIFAGSIKNAIVLILIFVLCYILREILEPRLIGEKVGLPSITSLVAIYVGYKLFGIVGVILGPVAYILISEALKISEKNTEVADGYSEED